jgi:uncharacterized protein YndB with AHSA1/START domain
MAAETSLETPGDLQLTRLIDAPREVVFEVWTQAEHLAQWFGPRQVELPVCQVDARPGGALHFCHRVGDGTEVWVKGEYREVVPPQRLVFSSWFSDREGRAGVHPMFPELRGITLLTTVTLIDRQGKTELTVRQQILPPEAAAAARGERECARAGWTETLDRLVEYVRTRA